MSSLLCFQCFLFCFFRDLYLFFFFNDTATTLIYTLSLHDALPIYVPHRHVYGEQWIKFMKDGVNATPLPTVNTTGYIDHAAFLGTINPDTNKIGMVNITSSVNSRERSGINTILHERSEERFSMNADTA